MMISNRRPCGGQFVPVTLPVLFLLLAQAFAVAQDRPHLRGPDTVVPSPTAPFQATGFKIGEVTDSTAIIWTRLSQRAKPNPATAPMVRFIREEADGGTRRIVGVRYPDGGTVADIRFAVPGIGGQVRVRYRPEEELSWQNTAWKDVDSRRDFTGCSGWHALRQDRLHRRVCSRRFCGHVER